MIGTILLLLVCMATAGLAESENGKTNYAVLPLRNADGVSAGEASLLTDRLRIEIFNSGLANLMEREQMQEVLTEQGFQHSGACTDDACLVEMGQLLGVERMISGSVGRLGKTLVMLNMRVIDVRTGRLVGVVAKDIRGEIEEVVAHLPALGRELLGGGIVAPGAPEATSEASPPPAESELPAHAVASGDIVTVQRQDVPGTDSQNGQAQRRVRLYLAMDISGMFIEHRYLGFSPTLGIEIQRRHLIALHTNLASKQSDDFERLFMLGGGLEYLHSLVIGEKIVPRLGIIAGFWNEFPDELDNSFYDDYEANYWGGPRFRLDLGTSRVCFTPLDVTALLGARWTSWGFGNEDSFAVKMIFSAGIALRL